ncbi:MAG TPA: hypothetical protein VG893_15770 [Terracidiphilus sp.]|nr:hypothetical protein [Terracidiphilus sp.]
MDNDTAGSPSGKAPWGWIVFLLIVIIVLLVRFSGNKNGDRDQEARAEAARIAAQHFAELRLAAVTAGFHLDSAAHSQDPDYNAESGRLLAINAKSSQQFTNPELSKAWAQIVADSGAGMVILERIGRIDAEKPSGYEILSKALQDDSPEQEREVERAASARIADEMDKAALQQDYRETESQLDNAIGALAQIAEGLGEPASNAALGVQFYPSWDGTYWGDEVVVQNNSAASLDNAVEVVTVNYANGSRTHVHYSDAWPAGASLKAMYPYRDSDYVAGQATPAGLRPQSVDVAVYTAGGVAHGDLPVTDASWDDTIRSYCAKLTFSAQYLGAYTDDDGQQFAPGFKFAFQGLNGLPIRAVTAQITDAAGASHSVRWSYDAGAHLNPGDEQALRSDLVDASPPAHLAFTLSLADSGYEPTVTVY